jgi:hypothetical protein
VGYYYNPERRVERLARRVPLSNGYLFHPDAPTHGTWTGYNYWCCQCTVCRDLGRRAARLQRERRIHNQRVIERLSQPMVSTPAVDPGPYVEPGRPLASVTVLEPALPPERARKAVSAGRPQPLPDLEFAWPEDLPVPTVSPGARPFVRDPDHLVAIARAVVEPEVVTPHPLGGRRHSYGPVVVVVADDGTVVRVSDREQADGPSQLLSSAPRALPKARGGRGGRRKIGSTGDLIEALRKLRVPIERTGSGHWKVHCPDGTFYVTGSTHSDWRGTLNAVAELRQRGVAL